MIETHDPLLLAETIIHFGKQYKPRYPAEAAGKAAALELIAEFEKTPDAALAAKMRGFAITHDYTTPALAAYMRIMARELDHRARRTRFFNQTGNA